MIKKAEGEGIGIIGVFLAILLILFLRGWIDNEVQKDINDFCINNGFDYGQEKVRNTMVVCENYRNDEYLKFSYGYYEYNNGSQISEDSPKENLE